MKDKEPLIILLVLFLLLGLAWDPIKKSGGLGGLFTTLPSNPASPTQSPAPLPTPSPINLPTNNSPFYGKINISYTTTLANSNPSAEYIALNTSLESGEKVNITGWTLRSERSNNWVRIGRASILPLLSNSQSYQDVIVGQGDNIYVVKGFSPINISFRSNKCTGYFEEDRTFYPSLSQSCPTARSENLPQFSTDLDRDDECRHLIETVPACSTPGRVMNLNRLEDTVTTSCKEYLRTRINYNSCLAGHVGDKDFAGKEWYVYLNILGPLWRDKLEKINLYDNQGLLVSSYTY